MSRTLCRIVWVLSTIGLCGALIAFASNPVAIPAPASDMAEYTTTDKSLTISHPSNWLPRQLSANATQTEIEFLPARGVYFDIKGDLQGSLMADITKSTGVSMGEGLSGSSFDMGGLGSGSSSSGHEESEHHEARKSPVLSLHEAGMEKVAQDLANFEDGGTKELRISGMEAYATDFTFHLKNVFSHTEAVGRKVTTLNGERRVTIYYYYPKSAQSTIQPVFEKMLKSIKIGSVGG